MEIKALKIEKLLDLYCGVGAFSFYAAKYCQKIDGVEISKEAISFANMGKEKNCLHQINFQAMDTADFLQQNLINYDGVMVNPPRRGLDEEIIKNIITINPRIIFYSSCNAETLKKDWISLKNHFKIVSLQLFDMFPHTSHFETLMILLNKGSGAP